MGSLLAYICGCHNPACTYKIYRRQRYSNYWTSRDKTLEKATIKSLGNNHPELEQVSGKIHGIQIKEILEKNTRNATERREYRQERGRNQLGNPSRMLICPHIYSAWIKYPAISTQAFSHVSCAWRYPSLQWAGLLLLLFKPHLATQHPYY